MLKLSQSHCQVPENEQWRYVNLYIDLFNRVPYTIWTDSIGNELTDTQLFERQIGKSIFPSSKFKNDTIILNSIKNGKIIGQLFKTGVDTLKLKLNDGWYSDFRTEVQIENKWYTFQIHRPLGCGMGIGNALLFPNYYCAVELFTKTKGNIQLPFRLIINVDNKKITSNAVKIQCNKLQYKMIRNKIRNYTF